MGYHSFTSEIKSQDKPILELKKQSFELKQFEAAEAEILEYYDQNCPNGIYCEGCARNMAIEREILKKHGITDLEAFEELFSRIFY